MQFSERRLPSVFKPSFARASPPRGHELPPRDGSAWSLKTRLSLRLPPFRQLCFGVPVSRCPGVQKVTAPRRTRGDGNWRSGEWAGSRNAVCARATMAGIQCYCLQRWASEENARREQSRKNVRCLLRGWLLDLCSVELASWEKGLGSCTEWSCSSEGFSPVVSPDRLF